jgi:hypothetical protein
MTANTLVILGAGYLARFMPAVIEPRYSDVRFTSRTPDTHLAHVSPAQRLRFDLARPDTWRHLPQGTDWLWCFPAAPLDAVHSFATSTKGSFRRLVVLGSTSAYDAARPHNEYPPEWIDETAAIDVSQPRVQGEEFLRKDCAAVVLRIAGMYGPGRSPFDWIRSGRVGPSRKYVNLIHVEDLAVICLIALKQGAPGEVYNVSDGTPRTWSEICEHLPGYRPLDGPSGTQEHAPGKRISNAKLVSMLRSAGASLRHPDLFSSLAKLQEQMP